MFCESGRKRRNAYGAPERRTAAQRMKSGIPVDPNLLVKVKEIALASGVDHGAVRRQLPLAREA